MSATFPVEWRQLFKSLTIFMSVAIAGSVVLLGCIRFVATGFDYDKTFEHMSLLMMLLILGCTPFVSAAFSLVIALWLRIAAITISEGMIHGRNFWGLKNRIPLDDITKLTFFSSNGINAIVVNSNHHGQVYISDKTQRLSELLEILAPYLPSEHRFPE